MKNYCFIPHHCAWREGGDSNSGPDYRPQGLLPLWSEGSHSDALIQLKTDGKSASASAV